MSSCKLHSIDRTPSKLNASEHAVVVRKSQPVWICKWSEVKSPFMSAGWRWITVRGAEINTEMAGVADRNRIHIQRPRCQPIPSACSSSHFISAPSLPSPVYFLPAPGSDFLNILLWIELERMDINKVAVARSSCRDWTVGCVHWCRAAVLSTVMSSARNHNIKSSNYNSFQSQQCLLAWCQHVFCFKLLFFFAVVKTKSILLHWSTILTALVTF